MTLLWLIVVINVAVVIVTAIAIVVVVIAINAIKTTGAVKTAVGIYVNRHQTIFIFYPICFLVSLLFVFLMVSTCGTAIPR